MNRGTFIKTARILSAAGQISATNVVNAAMGTSRSAQALEFDPATLKQFQEILGYSDERFNSFLQNQTNRAILLQIGEIAKKIILFEVLKKTL